MKTFIIVVLSVVALVKLIAFGAVVLSPGALALSLLALFVGLFISIPAIRFYFECVAH